MAEPCFAMAAVSSMGPSVPAGCFWGSLPATTARWETRERFWTLVAAAGALRA